MRDRGSLDTDPPTVELRRRKRDQGADRVKAGDDWTQTGYELTTKAGLPGHLEERVHVPVGSDVLDGGELMMPLGKPRGCAQMHPCSVPQ